MEKAPALQFSEKPSLEQVRRRFETWRQKGRPGGRIPKSLWQAAAMVCSEHPVHQVSRALGLNYNQLKLRAAAAGAVSNDPGLQSFVELFPAVNPAPCPCTVRLESADGAKLTLEFSGPVDPLELVRVFLRRRS